MSGSRIAAAYGSPIGIGDLFEATNSSVLWRAFRPIVNRHARFNENRMRADLQASASPAGSSTPVWLSTTISAVPQRLLASTARPQAAASNTTFGRPSCRLGTRTASDSRIWVGTASGLIAPSRWTRSGRRRPARHRTRCRSSGGPVPGGFRQLSAQYRRAFTRPACHR